MKKMIKYIFALLTFSGAYTFAQDVHFSHLEFSPLSLNPALAGANSPMQGIVNYRSQWNSVAVPYQTIAASFDARLNEKKRRKKGIMAAGISFFNDQAGEMKVKTTSANLTLAYHLIIDRKSTIGLGMYTGFGQRSLDPNGGRWGSQYDGASYNASLASGESFNSSSFMYLDAGTGVLYTFKEKQGYITQNDQRAFNAGFSVYHLNRPGYSFIDKSSENLHMRWSAFVNAEFGLRNSRASLLPGIYFQRQKSTMEILYGLYYKYLLSEGSKATGFTRPAAVYFGLFHRFNDALVGKFMFEWDQLSAGFAYDINVSSLTPVSKSRGGFELFLRFNMGDGGGFRARI
jgi:type IX secretion system PorP/SprF family membrane protein